MHGPCIAIKLGATQPLLSGGLQTNNVGRRCCGKDAVLADAKSETWSSAEYTDLKVTLFGRTAIATGTFIDKGANAAGKRLGSSRSLMHYFLRIGLPSCWTSRSCMSLACSSSCARMRSNIVRVVGSFSPK